MKATPFTMTCDALFNNPSKFTMFLMIIKWFLHKENKSYRSIEILYIIPSLTLKYKKFWQDINTATLNVFYVIQYREAQLYLNKFLSYRFVLLKNAIDGKIIGEERWYCGFIDLFIKCKKSMYTQKYLVLCKKINQNQRKIYVYGNANNSDEC